MPLFVNQFPVTDNLSFSAQNIILQEKQAVKQVDLPTTEKPVLNLSRKASCGNHTKDYDWSPLKEHMHCAFINWQLAACCHVYPVMYSCYFCYWSQQIYFLTHYLFFTQ